MKVHKFHDTHGLYTDVTACGIVINFENTTKKDYHVDCKNCRRIMAKQCNTK